MLPTVWLTFFVFRQLKQIWSIRSESLEITWPSLIHTSSTGCTSIHCGFCFCYMLWYNIAVHCNLFYFESVRSIVRQRKNNNILLVKCIPQSFKLSLLTGLSELLLIFLWILLIVSQPFIIIYIDMVYLVRCSASLLKYMFMISCTAWVMNCHLYILDTT